jgi:hypothetical protein
MPDGTGIRRLTNGGTQATQPRMGRWIAYGELVNESAHVVRPDGSEEKLSPGQPMFWMHEQRARRREGDDHVLIDRIGKQGSCFFESAIFRASVTTCWRPGQEGGKVTTAVAGRGQ